MWFMAGLWAVAAPVADVLPPAPIGTVHLGGLIGARLDATALNRLIKMDESALLAGFRQRPGTQAWVGEHVGKFLHAATLAWVYTGDPRLRDKIDRVTAGLLACQLDDGYLGTYAHDQHWTAWDVWVHKYCLYGLLTVAQHTGSPEALAASRKIGDLLCATFGEGKRDIIASGTHVGMAATSVMEPMMLLYQATGDARYREFCEYLVRSWEQPHGPRILSSLLAHGKVNQTSNGKAYEMMSNLVGLCELYRATGHGDYLAACRRAWDDIAANQCYLTGGTSLAEHFQPDGHLPNPGRVSENCAQVTWEQLTAQLLRLTGEAKYAAMLERLVYNHLLGSQRPTLSGICYFTPLEGVKPFGDGINCCTSSNPRGMMLIPTLAWSVAGNAVTALVHAPGELRFELDGTPVTVRQTADYPTEPRLAYVIEAPRPVQLTLRTRRPAGSGPIVVRRNGEPVDVPDREFIELSALNAGDRVTIETPMPIEVIEGSTTNDGLLAVRRGPVVYAVDQADNPGLKIGLIGLDPAVPPRLDNGLVVTEPLAPERYRLPAGAGLRWRPFYEAGAEGSRFAVWLRGPSAIRDLGPSILVLGEEIWSREGNVGGSINDGDPGSWRVTYDGTRQPEDWFAVTLHEPETIARVSYAHGHDYHDGGWFDTTTGKPRIEVQRTPGGAWETVATLDAYPVTTATDRAGLQPGDPFEVRFAPVEVVAVRVIGAGACGDSPQQCFASCAELEAFAD